MGAEQSTQSDRPSGGPTKTCYYELLAVDRQATDDEIKKAYRKKALELHPDRNYGDVERATAKFAEVQSAYEVLSDPHERAWYDSHRLSILGGFEHTDEQFEVNDPKASTAHIISLVGRFNSNTPFTDAPDGFFGTLQETFVALAKEEFAACRDDFDVVDYPEFGSAKDNYEDVAKPFYKVWSAFSTQRSFSWADRYRTSDAPDRYTRRVMEAENKKSREKAKAEFNAAVTHLVMFARRRDPRYTPNTQTEAERQKALRDAALAQAARSRAANLNKLNDHVIPDWAKTQDTEEETIESEESEIEVNEIECVACKKSFKSENQYEAHAKSKKHMKAVQLIQKQIRKENKKFKLDTTSEQGTDTPTDEFEKLDLEDEHDKEDVAQASDVNTAIETTEELDDQSQNSSSEEEPGDASAINSDIENDDYAPRTVVEDRLADILPEQEDIPEVGDSATEEKSTPDTSGPKLGKAKAKRAKKAAQKEAAGKQGNEFKCEVKGCGGFFPSKNSLFTHIKTHRLAAAPKAPKEKKKK